MRKWFLLACTGVLLLPVMAMARDARPLFGAAPQADEQHAMKRGPAPGPHGDRGKRAEHDKRHQGRLTDQERRDLHRDLDRANREIYRR